MRYNEDTSREAWDAIQRRLPKLEARVYQALRDLNGATCDRVEEITGMPHQTASARMRGLRDKGLVGPSGAMAKTRSGKRAEVMMALPPPHELVQRKLFQATPVAALPPPNPLMPPVSFPDLFCYRCKGPLDVLPAIGVGLCQTCRKKQEEDG